MRFKNFSNEPIEVLVKVQTWTHEAHGGSFIQIAESTLIEAGEITTDFPSDDPMVKLLLKAHPELRPLIVLSSWQKVLDGIL